MRVAAGFLLLFMTTTAGAVVTAGKSVVLAANGVGVTYQIDASNFGSSSVNAFAVDNVPATIVNLQATVLSGGGTVSIDHATGSVWWTGISIPANGTATLVITGSVRSGAPPGTVVSNQATVQYDSDGNGTEDTAVATNIATFVVPSVVCVPPTITVPPEPLYKILPGGSQTLSVQATGTGLTYKWTFIYPVSGTEGTEGTTPTVTVTPPYSRQYQITVENPCGRQSAFTNVCIIPRVLPPELEQTADPAQAILSVTIDPLLSFRDWPTLQWYHNSQPITDATSSFITIDPAQGGTYWVRATNSCATYDSAAVTTAAAADAIPALSPVSLVLLALALAAVAILVRRV